MGKAEQKYDDITASGLLDGRDAIENDNPDRLQQIIDKLGQQAEAHLLIEVIREEYSDPETIKEWLQIIEPAAGNRYSDQYPAFYNKVLSQYSDQRSVRAWFLKQYQDKISPNMFATQMRNALSDQDETLYCQCVNLLKSHPDKGSVNFASLTTGLRGLIRSKPEGAGFEAIRTIHTKTPDLLPEDSIRKIIEAWVERNEEGEFVPDEIGKRLYDMAEDQDDTIKKKLLRHADLSDTQDAALRL